MIDAKSIIKSDGGEQHEKKGDATKQRRSGFQLPRPQGMQRELYNLLAATKAGQLKMDAIIASHTKDGVRLAKLQMGKRPARRWLWTPFNNEAREDGLKLSHWMREDRINPSQPYVFAKFNKKFEVPSFNDDEYEEHLRMSDWTKEETRYLFEVCQQFDLRWPIVYDRYDQTKFGQRRSMEDLKERYYAVAFELSMQRESAYEPMGYDAEHERKRKEQLTKLWDRTPEEWEEEEQLIAELERIEVRKRERERKAQDLQKLISMTDMSPASPSGSATSTSLKKGQIRQKTGLSSNASMSFGFNPEVSVTQLRFSEFRGSGAHLRSQEMKLPTNIGLKKLKNIETVIDKMKLEMNPMGAEDIVTAYNDFRSDIVLLQELKATLQTAEFDLESLRTRHQQQGGQPFEIEPRMRVSILPEGGLSSAFLEGPGAPTSSRRITSYLELISKTDALNNPRKRKAPPPPGTITPSNSTPDLKRTRKSVL